MNINTTTGRNTTSSFVTLDFVLVGFEIVKKAKDIAVLFDGVSPHDKLINYPSLYTALQELRDLFKNGVQMRPK